MPGNGGELSASPPNCSRTGEGEGLPDMEPLRPTIFSGSNLCELRRHCGEDGNSISSSPPDPVVVDDDTLPGVLSSFWPEDGMGICSPGTPWSTAR